MKYKSEVQGFKVESWTFNLDWRLKSSKIQIKKIKGCITLYFGTIWNYKSINGKSFKENLKKYSSAPSKSWHLSAATCCSEYKCFSFGFFFSNCCMCFHASEVKNHMVFFSVFLTETQSHDSNHWLYKKCYNNNDNRELLRVRLLRKKKCAWLGVRENYMTENKPSLSCDCVNETLNRLRLKRSQTQGNSSLLIYFGMHWNCLLAAW